MRNLYFIGLVYLLILLGVSCKKEQGIQPYTANRNSVNGPADTVSGTYICIDSLTYYYNLGDTTYVSKETITLTASGLDTVNYNYSPIIFQSQSSINHSMYFYYSNDYYPNDETNTLSYFINSDSIVMTSSYYNYESEYTEVSVFHGKRIK